VHREFKEDLETAKASWQGKLAERIAGWPALGEDVNSADKLEFGEADFARAQR
jgi:hypothetical protein